MKKFFILIFFVSFFNQAQSSGNILADRLAAERVNFVDHYVQGDFKGVQTYLRDTASINVVVTLFAAAFYCIIVFQWCPDLSPRHCVN